MLGVIRESAIGHHEVTEKKVIEGSIKRTVQITTVTKHPPPFKYPGKIGFYFLENFKNRYFGSFQIFLNQML
jgi:hypothetical protein